jgi:iron complex transport system substrate-binding protein
MARALLVCAVLVVVVACRAAGESPAAGGVRVSDDLGRAVVLARPATRIASLSPSNTEILFALGCGERIVLRDRVSAHPPAALRLPATSPFTLSAEHVAGFAPDLVLLSHVDAQRLRALQQAGLVAASFDPRTLEQLHGNIRAIGTLCGAEGPAARLVGELRRRAEHAAAAVRGRARPKVYVETDGADPLKPWTAGPGSFVDELLQLAGGRNVASTLRRPYAQINAEEVFAAQPDVILLMGVEGELRLHRGAPEGREPGELRGHGLARLRGRPAWGSLEAVRRGRVIDTIHPDLLSRPGPRLVDGLEALARALHPEPSPTGPSAPSSPAPAGSSGSHPGAHR